MRLIAAVSLSLLSVTALPNKQLTPPMGWSTWSTFGCTFDEQLILEHAQILVSSGMRDAGYVFVNIDDCWMLPRRDRYGKLVEDPKKFPHGLKSLAQQIHGLGLKLGIYEAPGIFTCQGFPGSFGHEYSDAQQYADWEIDFFKYDNCYMYFRAFDYWVPSSDYNMSLEVKDAHPLPPFRPSIGGELDLEDAYQLMGEALNATGREFVYSICPMSSGCNISTTRFYQDIANMCMNQCLQGDSFDDWANLLRRIDEFNKLGVGTANIPGYFTDLDLLWVGAGAQTPFEYRACMGLYAMLASPMISGIDLRKLTPAILDLYTNKEMIAINQDKSAVAAKLVNQEVNNTQPGPDKVVWQVYAKNLTVTQGPKKLAVLLWNRSPAARDVSVDFVRDLSLPPNTQADVREVWQQSGGHVTGSYTARGVGTHDAMLIILTLA